ncbi:MAG: radical SAM family heme chaperone HemW [Desulfobacter sp.]|nr:radical SAM family heme chaperone HemW [Desulfobacter sp.]
MFEHLYIHVPFCIKKCRYCDFYSQTNLSWIPAYVSALCREISLGAAAVLNETAVPNLVDPGSLVKTIYFGGGTPSVLPLGALETILKTLYRCHRIDPHAEITLEANPGTLDPDYLKGLKSLGINRLSLGVQSFDNKKLGLLGRIHIAAQSVNAIEAARAAGFDNLGLDMIFGVPKESNSFWKREMDTALGFCPEHLSCYMLTLEKDTPLYIWYEKGRFIPMAPDARADLFAFTDVYLENHGFSHYEISNFAGKKKNRSQHNSSYWDMVPYKGFGPSAHSYAVLPGSGKNLRHQRSWNCSDLNAYVDCLAQDRLPVDDYEILGVEEQMLERIMVGLRTDKGVDIKGFNGLSGSSFQTMFKDLVEQLESQRMGKYTGQTDRFGLTRAGWACLDSIVEAFARKIKI